MFLALKGDPMPYDFQEEATLKQMASRWHISYPRLCRIVRNMGEVPARLKHVEQYFDRASQHRIGERLAFYQKHPKALAQAERLIRAQEASEKMSREIRLM